MSAEDDVFAALLQLAAAGEQQQQQPGKAPQEQDYDDDMGEIAEVLDDPVKPEREPAEQTPAALSAPAFDPTPLEDRVFLEECPTNKDAVGGNQKRVRAPSVPLSSFPLHPFNLSALCG